LLGKTLIDIKGVVGDTEMIFTTITGEVYKLYHYQDCCECVSVEDICGDLIDLIGSPLLVVEEVLSDKNPPGVNIPYQDSFTWTFYKLSTIKGSVTIRWYGKSNGYYSERVDFKAVRKAIK
jgi:hypothetical protein